MILEVHSATYKTQTCIYLPLHKNKFIPIYGLMQSSTYIYVNRNVNCPVPCCQFYKIDKDNPQPFSLVQWIYIPPELKSPISSIFTLVLCST